MSTKKIINRKNSQDFLQKQKKYYIFGIATLIVLIDLITKIIVRKNIAIGTKIKILPFFYLNHLENTGTFFGVARHSTGFLTFFSLIVIAIIIYGYKSIPEEKFLYFMTAFVLGGAIGNLIDRMFLGSVTDFFDFLIWPVFNVADIFISMAIIGLCWYAFRKD